MIDCFKGVILSETGLNGQNAQRSRVLPELFQALNLITVGLGENPKENLHCMMRNIQVNILFVGNKKVILLEKILILDLK